MCSCAVCEANLNKLVEEMLHKSERLTDESTRHSQAIGVLKVISDNAARGITLMEQQVKQMTEQTNTHLEAMINTVKDIQTQFLQRVGVNIEEAEQTNTHLEAMINTVKDIQTQFLQRVVNIEEAVANVNTVVKKSHVGLDIGTLILLLFAFFVSRYLRLHTGNDLISLGGYIILSFIELAFLIYAFQLSANILHKHLTGEDIENETLLQLAFGTGCLIVSILVILLVVRLTVTCMGVAIYSLERENTSGNNVWLAITKKSLYQAARRFLHFVHHRCKCVSLLFDVTSGLRNNIE